jgi:hypothetical protein
MKMAPGATLDRAGALFVVYISSPHEL